MIGNENRNNGFTGKDGGIVETDVIDNKKLTSGKCQMSCGHFTGYYLLIHIFKNAKVYMLIHRINCNLIGYLSYILFLYCFLLKYSVSILQLLLNGRPTSCFATNFALVRFFLPTCLFHILTDFNETFVEYVKSKCPLSCKISMMTSIPLT